MCYNHFMIEGMELKEKTNETIAPGLGNLNLENVEEKRKIIEELIFQSEKIRNKLNFLEEGDDWEPTVKDVKIDQNLLEKFKLEDSDMVELSLKVFKYYLACPLFTDEFKENNTERRKWEDKFKKNVSEKAFQFYLKNRLSINSANGAEGFLRLLKNQISDIDCKKELSEIEDKIPKEFLEIDNKDYEKKTIYNTLKNETEKIKIMKDFESLIRQAVLVLENKK